MVLKNVKLKLKKTAEERVKLPEEKEQSLLGKLWNGIQHNPGTIYLLAGVEEADIEVKGENKKVSQLAVEMTQKGKEDEGSDILSDSLLNPQNIGKEFELFQFNTENADLFYSENAKGLWIPREALHNLTPIKGDNYTELIDYVGPSDEEIDNADENQCKKYIEELKQAYGKGEKPGKMDKTHSELQNLVDLINSTGTYYEIHSEIGYTARWNGLSNEVKLGIEGKNYTTPYSPDDKTMKDVRTDLKKRVKEFKDTIDPKKEEIKYLKMEIAKWKKNGGITDQQYNDKIEKWKNISNHATLAKYNEVKAKVEGGDPNFSKYLIQFKTESERSENGVSANQALPTLTLGEKIEDKYFYLFKNTALTDDERIQKLNEKKAKKQAFNNTKDVRKKIENILERKDKVINLIEDLVAGRGPDTPDISQVRDRAKSDIQTELNTAPKTENSELGQNADWENKLNGLDKENEINNFKNKLITEIKNIRTRKESGSKLDKLLAEAKSKENYEELEPVMKNIAKFSRTTAYKNKKTEIEAQQRRLQDYDPTGKKYAKTVHTIIGEALSEVSLNEQDLGDKIKKDLKDLKDNNISDKQKIKGIEEAALKKIGETNANKKFKLIKDKADKAISSNDKTKIDEAKTEINNFLAIDDIYFQAKNTEAQQLLKCLNIPNQHNNGGDKDNSSNFPWKVVVPIVLGAIVIIGVALVMVWKKKEVKEE